MTATLRPRYALAAAAFAVLALAGCASTHIKAAGHPAAQPSAASTIPGASDTPTAGTTTPAALSGPLGTSFTVTTQDDNGNDVSYDVTAKRLLDPARGTDEFTTPDAGKRFVGVKFTITGDAGYSHDDADNDAVIIGSDGQVYQPTFDSIAAGTNFDSGDFSVNAGQSQTGWVTFQLPHGVGVASIQWQPGIGDTRPATWTAGG